MVTGSRKTWDKPPGELKARDVIDTFMKHVSRGDFLKAITLCPVFSFSKKVGKPEDRILKPTAKLAKAVAEDIQESMEAYLEEMDDFKPSKKWFQLITPPSTCHFKGFNYFAHPIPANATGYVYNDVLGNVYFNNKVTDVTAVFSFVNVGSKWILAFKMFKTM